MERFDKLLSSQTRVMRTEHRRLVSPQSSFLNDGIDVKCWAYSPQYDNDSGANYNIMGMLLKNGLYEKPY